MNDDRNFVARDATWAVLGCLLAAGGLTIAWFGFLQEQAVREAGSDWGMYGLLGMGAAGVWLGVSLKNWLPLRVLQAGVTFMAVSLVASVGMAGTRHDVHRDKRERRLASMAWVAAHPGVGRPYLFATYGGPTFLVCGDLVGSGPQAIPRSCQAVSIQSEVAQVSGGELLPALGGCAPTPDSCEDVVGLVADEYEAICNRWYNGCETVLDAATQVAERSAARSGGA